MPTNQKIQISVFYIHKLAIYGNFESISMIFYEVCYGFLWIYHNYTWHRYRRYNNIIQNNGFKLYADRSKNSNFLSLNTHIYRNICQV